MGEKTAPRRSKGWWGRLNVVSFYASLVFTAVMQSTVLGSHAVAQSIVIAPGSGNTSLGNTSTGVTSVNIATPTNGTSLNTYTNFNISSDGLVLNNSNAITNTQAHGYVDLNHNLATSGTASIIVNEVVGSSNSNLFGTLEVAGAEADIFIVNPNGITCNGCGFINTDDLILGAATATVLGDGSVVMDSANGGQVTIGQAGLDQSGGDTVTLFGQTISYDGTIVAGQEIRLIAGKDTTFNTQTGQVLGGGTQNGMYAIDGTALGAAKAGSITIIGTDQGLGVRSAGSLNATYGNVSITSNGSVVNSGTISSGSHDQASVSITADSLENSGTITSKGTSADTGTVAINVGGSLVNIGTIEGGNVVSLLAGIKDIDWGSQTDTNGDGTVNLLDVAATDFGSGAFSNGNATQAGTIKGKSVQLIAGTVANHKGSITTDGALNILLTGGGNANAQHTGSNLSLDANSGGIWYASGSLALTALHGDLVLDQDVSQAIDLTIQVLNGGISASDGANIQTTENLILVAGGDLALGTGASFEAGQNLTAQASGDLSNLGGLIKAGGTLIASTVGNMTANSGTTTSDRAGFEAGGAMTLVSSAVQSFTNTDLKADGKITLSGATGLTTNGATLTSLSDEILAVTQGAGSFANTSLTTAADKALIVSADQGLTLDTVTTTIGGSQTYVTGGAAAISGSTFGQQSGATAGDFIVSSKGASTFNNSTVNTAGNATMVVEAIKDAGGTVTTQGTLSSTGSSITTGGDLTISANDALTLASFTGTVGTGAGQDGKSTLVTTGAFSSTSSTITSGGQNIVSADGSVLFNTSTLDGSGVTLVTQGDITSNTSKLLSDVGLVVSAGGAATFDDLTATITGSDAATGSATFVAKNDLTFGGTASTITTSAGDVVLSSEGNLGLSNTTLTSGKAATLVSTGMLSGTSSALTAATDLVLSGTGGISGTSLTANAGGKLTAVTDQSITLASSNLTSTGQSILSAGDALSLTGTNLNAAQAVLFGKNGLTIDGGGVTTAGDVTVTNPDGTTSTTTSLVVQTLGDLALKNSAALTSTDGAMTLVATRALTTDAASTIKARTDLILNGTNSITTAGTLQSETTSVLAVTDGQFTNTGDITAATDLNIQGIGGLTNSGTLTATSGAATLYTEGALANNGTGKITAGTNLTLRATNDITSAVGAVLSAGQDFTAVSDSGSFSNQNTASIGAQQSVTISAQSISNVESYLYNVLGDLTLISENQDLLLASGDNINAGGDLYLSFKSIENTQGNTISSGGDMTLAATDHIYNTGSTIESTGDLTFLTPTFKNLADYSKGTSTSQRTVCTDNPWWRSCVAETRTVTTTETITSYTPSNVEAGGDVLFLGDASGGPGVLFENLASMVSAGNDILIVGTSGANKSLYLNSETCNHYYGRSGTSDWELSRSECPSSTNTVAYTATMNAVDNFTFQGSVAGPNTGSYDQQDGQSVTDPNMKGGTVEDILNGEAVRDGTDLVVSISTLEELTGPSIDDVSGVGNGQSAVGAVDGEAIQQGSSFLQESSFFNAGNIEAGGVVSITADYFENGLKGQTLTGVGTIDTSKLGSINGAGGINLDVGYGLNTGFLISENGSINIQADTFENIRRTVLQDIGVATDFAVVAGTRFVGEGPAITEIRMLQEGGEISGTNVTITATGDLRNVGGLLLANGTEDCSTATPGTPCIPDGNLTLTVGGNFENMAQVSDQVSWWEDPDQVLGMFTTGSTTEYDVGDDYTSANAIASGVVNILVDGDATISGSNVAGYGGAQLIAGGDIVVEDLVTKGPILAQTKECKFLGSLCDVKQIQTIEVATAGIYSVDGNTTLIAGSGFDDQGNLVETNADANITTNGGTILSSLGSVTLQAANDITMNAVTESVDQVIKQVDLGFLSVGETEVLWNDTVNNTTSLSAGQDLRIIAGNDIYGEGVQAGAGNDIALQFGGDATFEGSIVDNYFEVNSWSLSLTGTGIDDVRTVLDKGLDGLLDNYVSSTPLGSLEQIAQAGNGQPGVNAAINGAIDFVSQGGALNDVFTGGVEGGIDGLKDQFNPLKKYDDLAQGQFSVGLSISSSQQRDDWESAITSSLTAGNDLTITGGGADSKLNLLDGTQGRAGDDLVITQVGDTILQGLALDSSTSSKSSSLGVSLNFGGADGVSVGLNASGSNYSGFGTDWTNAGLVAGTACDASNPSTDPGDPCGALVINTTGDLSLIAANVHGNVTDIDVGGNLTLESRQDTYEGSGSNWGANITFVPGGGVTGLGFNSGQNSQDKAMTGLMSSITANGTLDLDVGGTLDITGAVIGSGTNDLTVDAGAITITHLEDRDNSQSSSSGIQLGQGSDGWNLPTFNVANSSTEKTGTTYGTLGQGTYTIGGDTVIHDQGATLTDDQLAYLTQNPGSTISNTPQGVLGSSHYDMTQKNFVENVVLDSGALDVVGGSQDYELIYVLRGEETTTQVAAKQPAPTPLNSNCWQKEGGAAANCDGIDESMRLFGGGDAIIAADGPLAGANLNVGAAQTGLDIIEQEFVLDLNLQGITDFKDNLDKTWNLAEALTYSDEKIEDLVGPDAADDPDAADIIRQQIARGASQEDLDDYINSGQFETDFGARQMYRDIESDPAATPEEVASAAYLILQGERVRFADGQMILTTDCETQQTISTSYTGVDLTPCETLLDEGYIEELTSEDIASFVEASLGAIAEGIDVAGSGLSSEEQTKLALECALNWALTLEGEGQQSNWEADHNIMSAEGLAWLGETVGYNDLNWEFFDESGQRVYSEVDRILEEAGHDPFYIRAGVMLAEADKLPPEQREDAYRNLRDMATLKEFVSRYDANQNAFDEPGVGLPREMGPATDELLAHDDPSFIAAVMRGEEQFVGSNGFILGKGAGIYSFQSAVGSGLTGPLNQFFDDDGNFDGSVGTVGEDVLLSSVSRGIHYDQDNLARQGDAAITSAAAGAGAARGKAGLSSVASGSVRNGLADRLIVVRQPTIDGQSSTWNVPVVITNKFPRNWGGGNPNKKGIGTRWQDPSNPGNGVRVDQGNPNHSLSSQQVDHVIVRVNGKVIGRDGKPIQGSIADNAENAHIPLSEYNTWTSWNSP